MKTLHSITLDHGERPLLRRTTSIRLRFTTVDSQETGCRSGYPHLSIFRTYLETPGLGTRFTHFYTGTGWLGEGYNTGSVYCLESRLVGVRNTLRIMVSLSLPSTPSPFGRLRGEETPSVDSPYDVYLYKDTDGLFFHSGERSPVHNSCPSCFLRNPVC